MGLDRLLRWFGPSSSQRDHARPKHFTPLAEHRRKSPRERWVIISNCQSKGLGCCFATLCPDIEFEVYRFQHVEKHRTAWRKYLQTFDRAILIPELRRLDIVSPQMADRVAWLPGVYFAAFHPDLCYVSAAKKNLKSPLEDYHSLIAVTTFLLGGSIEQALALYKKDIYQKIGYFSIWDMQKNYLTGLFSDENIDIQQDLRRWARDGIFMHAINHPRIHVLYDISRRVASTLGVAVQDSGFYPPDNLASGSRFPVFPEVAESLGFEGGSYYFKAQNVFHVMDLRTFVTESFEVYRNQDKQTLQPVTILAQAAMEVIGEAL